MRFLRRLWDWIGHFSTIVFAWGLAGSAVTTFLAWVFSDLSPGQVANFGVAVFLLIVASLGTWMHPIWERRHPDRETPIPRVELSDTSLAPTKPVESLVDTPPTDDEESSKEFLGDGVTIDYVLSLLQGRTDIQGEAATRPFVGKWMRVTGEVRSVGTWDLDSIVVGVNAGDNHRMTLFFDDEKWVSPLSVLALGETISVEGRIYRIDRVFGLSLDNCELIKRA